MHTYTGARLPLIGKVGCRLPTRPRAPAARSNCRAADPGEGSGALQGLEGLPASVRPASALACPCPSPCPHAMLGLQVSRDGHVLVRAAVSDDLLPVPGRASVVLFSMDGKYDAGPCFGRVGACSAMLVCFPCWLDGDEAGRADWFRRCGDRSVLWVTRPGIVMTPGNARGMCGWLRPVWPGTPGSGLPGRSCQGRLLRSHTGSRACPRPWSRHRVCPGACPARAGGPSRRGWGGNRE